MAKPSWKLAPALTVFREQLKQIAPDRAKASDGTIGDAGHSARKSDHNPDEDGNVCAMDVTHSTAPRGIDGDLLVKALQESGDDRLKYLIFKGRITTPGDITKWKKYTGANAHRHHVHISIKHGSFANSVRKWNLQPLVNYYLNAIDAPNTEPVAVILPEGEHLSTTTTVTSTVLTTEPLGEIKEEKPKLYNDIGLKATLQEDAKTVIPTGGLSYIIDNMAQFTGLPPWAIKLIGTIATVIIAVVIGWIVYRFVSYIMHTIRENHRVASNNTINANPAMMDITPTK